MRKNRFENSTIILMLMLNTIFFVYYLVLAFYTRPHYDDLHFLWNLKQMSIGEFVNEMYFSRSGRFGGYFLYGVIFKIILFVKEYRFFPILFWLIGVTICWSVAKSLFKSVAPFLLLNVVVLFYNIYVLTNIDFAVFNWLCAMGFYLYAPFLILTLYLLNKVHINWYHWFVLFLLSVFLGSGQEAFTPVVLVALFMNGLFYLKQYAYKFADTFQDIRVQKIIATGIISLFCFIIVVIAPGNYMRMKMPEFVTPYTFVGYVIAFAKAFVTFMYFISFYFPYYIILGTIFYYLGHQIPKKSLKIKYSHKHIVFISILIYFLYLLLSLFPNVYLWSGFGIQRNYTQVVFFTILFICFHFFLFGYFKAKFINKKMISFMNVGIIILIGIMMINLYYDTISAHKYAQSVDKRIELLENINKEGVTGIVSVDPISIPYTFDVKYLIFKLIGKKKNPQPVLYYISDTDMEPNEYAYHLKKVYGFNFLIKLKNDKQSTK